MQRSRGETDRAGNVAWRRVGHGSLAFLLCISAALGYAGLFITLDMKISEGQMQMALVGYSMIMAYICWWLLTSLAG